MEEEKTVRQEEWEDEPILSDDETPSGEGAAVADDPSGEGATDTDDPSGEDVADTDKPSGTDGTAPDSASGEGVTDTGNPSGKSDTPSPDSADAKESEPDYKALYEAQRERQNAENFRRIYQEQLAMTGNEAVARLIAANESGGKSYPLEDTPESQTGGNTTDFRAELTELQSLYPDATEMPQSVMKDFMGGKSLKDSYAAYRAAEDGRTIAALRQEIAALKKTASNQAAAPVRGSNGDAPPKQDLYIAGFDSDNDW